MAQFNGFSNDPLHLPPPMFTPGPIRLDALDFSGALSGPRVGLFGSIDDNLGRSTGMRVDTCGNVSDWLGRPTHFRIDPFTRVIAPKFDMPDLHNPLL